MVQTQDSLFTEGRVMTDERTEIRGAEMGRWLLVAVLVVVGVILYFVFAPDSRPVATPSVQEAP
jgi:hypothetical protein